MDAVGVDRAILVPPNWVGDMNETVLEAAARYPTRFAVIGRFNPKWPDAQDRLENWLEQPHMLGVRLTFHTKPYSDWLTDGSLDWYWAACERLGIPTVALVPGIAGKLRPILDRHPDLKIVIPHMACLLDSKVPEAFSRLNELIDLARYPHVAVMISSAPNYSNEPFPFPDVEPHIRRIFDAFGSHSMLWGSDLTRLRTSYHDCRAQIDSLEFLSEEDKEWILGKSLEATLGWPAET
jgi:predicted TIM-barrel fold metal-dependent hydrolase